MYAASLDSCACSRSDGVLLLMHVLPSYDQTLVVVVLVVLEVHLVVDGVAWMLAMTFGGDAGYECEAAEARKGDRESERRDI